MTTQMIEPRMELEQNLHMYRQMAKIRAFEEQVNELYKSAKMPGLAHLYVGEEAVAVGVCEALRRDDFITSTHRGHGHCLAKGASVNRMFAELLGKEPGYCRGTGRSMHTADPETANLGANAIVRGSAGIATGAAPSAKMRGTDQVAVCFFGDGALGQGLLYEVMNMAALWGLPVIYLCENNLYGEYTACGETIAGEILARPRSLGVHAESVDGQDVQAVHATMQRFVERARRGEGPAFLECKTYRYYGHHVGDVNREYRTRDEEKEWMSQHDPLATLAGRLSGQGLADQGVFDRIQTDVKAEIDTGVQFALAAPYPDANGKRDRKAVKLSEFRGQKNVVLAFFPAAFSPGCTSEMAKYRESAGEFNANNTVILGMSVDSVWANVAFAEKLGADFNILSDAKRDISRAYGVFDDNSVIARRTTFVIDRKGVVQKVFMAQEALDPAQALATCALLKEVK